MKVRAKALAQKKRKLLAFAKAVNEYYAILAKEYQSWNKNDFKTQSKECMDVVILEKVREPCLR